MCRCCRKLSSRKNSGNPLRWLVSQNRSTFRKRGSMSLTGSSRRSGTGKSRSGHLPCRADGRGQRDDVVPQLQLVTALSTALAERTTVPFLGYAMSDRFVAGRASPVGVVDLALTGTRHLRSPHVSVAHGHGSKPTLSPRPQSRSRPTGQTRIVPDASMLLSLYINGEPP